jgi:hypothetical protein
VGVAFLTAAIFVIITTVEEWEFPENLELCIEMKSSITGPARVYYDIGDGMNEKDSKTDNIAKRDVFQTLIFSLPAKPIQRLRFDPLTGAGNFSIRRIALFDNLNHLIQPIGLEALYPLKQIRYFEIEESILMAKTEPDAFDPILDLKFEYPLSLTSVYPVTLRNKDHLIEKFGHMRKTFYVVFLISWVAMLYACADLD